ncbi:DDE superfamily endonuclease [Popillia japonica]|uniref:DDE superfamily endonuclease n=1 Tax=Popillia japonica TaxID=7064 RepID=A0AAW1IYQ1_POPJA
MNGSQNISSIFLREIICLRRSFAHFSIEELCSVDGNIAAYSYPPNMTATMQPMDQDTIKSKLLAQIIAEGCKINTNLKHHSIRNAIFFLNQAWDKLSQNVLKNSLSKLLDSDSNQYYSDDDLPLAQLLQTEQVWNEVLERNPSHLEEIEPNNSILRNSDSGVSDSSHHVVMDEIPIIPDSTAMESVIIT